MRPSFSGPDRWVALIALVGVLATALWSPNPVSAQDLGVIPQGSEEVELDFQDLDLAYVMAALADAAGLNLIYHDLPDKAITLRTAGPIPREDLPSLIRSVASANGVAVSEDVGFLRLVGGGEAGEADPRQLFIYRLKHARAAELGATLQALFGNGPIPSTVSGVRATLSRQLREMQGANQPAQAQPSQIVVRTGGQEDGEGGSGESVLIVPEETTNSLLVRATPADWPIVEQAISSLDLRPLQVVIEVVIAEVRRTDDLDLGVTFEAIRETSGGVGSVELPPRPGTPDESATLQGIRFGSVDVNATLSALSTTGDVRILSRPVVLAQNNQEARILVGTQQPFVQFSQSLPGDPTGSRLETVQYREVGTVLGILPTINEDGYVNLSVAQEVSSATAETLFGAPVISTREAETQLLARNGQTVVMGGLVDQQVNQVHTGIPLLKDIPLLGYLFSSRSESIGSSELFLFLTPYIVATDDDADLLREFIEEGRELLAPYLPATPLTPPTPLPGGAIRTRPDSIGGGGSS